MFSCFFHRAGYPWNAWTTNDW